MAVMTEAAPTAAFFIAVVRKPVNSSGGCAPHLAGGGFRRDVLGSLR